MTDLYMETSVWSHAFADDAPESRRAALQLFELVQAGRFVATVSDVVTDEFDRADPDTRARLYSLMAQVEPVILEMGEEVEALAQRDIDAGIVPRGKQDDARHVAVASVNEVPFVVSLNHRHLVHPRRKELFGHLNAVHGYPTIELVAPQELCNG